MAGKLGESGRQVLTHCSPHSPLGSCRQHIPREPGPGHACFSTPLGPHRSSLLWLGGLDGIFWCRLCQELLPWQQQGFLGTGIPAPPKACVSHGAVRDGRLFLDVTFWTEGNTAVSAPSCAFRRCVVWQVLQIYFHMQAHAWITPYKKKLQGWKGQDKLCWEWRQNHYFFFSTINKIASQRQERPEAPFLPLPRADPLLVFPSSSSARISTTPIDANLLPQQRQHFSQCVYSLLSILFPHLLREKLSYSPVQSLFPHKYQCFPNTTYSQATKIGTLYRDKKLEPSMQAASVPQRIWEKEPGQNSGCDKAKEQGREKKKGQEGKKIRNRKRNMWKNFPPAGIPARKSWCPSVILLSPRKA